MVLSYLFGIVCFVLISPSFGAYCSSISGSRPDGKYCLYSRQKLVCRGGADVQLSVCKNGCEDGECIADAFCAQEKPLDTTLTPFCDKALHIASQLGTFDYRNNFNSSDVKARNLFQSLSNTTNTSCLERIYLYSCAVYFPSCQDRGDDCIRYSGLCGDVLLSEKLCLYLWKPDIAVLWIVIGICGFLGIIIAGVVIYVKRMRENIGKRKIQTSKELVSLTTET